MSATCRHALRRELPAIVDALIAGFMDDPLYRWLYPASETRPACLRETFALITDAAFERGHLYTNRDKTAAAAWTAPDVPLLDGDGEQAFVDMIRRHIGDRYESVLAGMAAVRRHAPSESHFALHNVAVHAASQGRGVGAALLAPVLARCDEDGLVAHLESSNPRNVAFYERLGFVPVAEIQVPADGPVMRSMTRAPGQAR